MQFLPPQVPVSGDAAGRAAGSAGTDASPPRRAGPGRRRRRLPAARPPEKRSEKPPRRPCNAVRDIRHPWSCFLSLPPPLPPSPFDFVRPGKTQPVPCRVESPVPAVEGSYRWRAESCRAVPGRGAGPVPCPRVPGSFPRRGTSTRCRPEGPGPGDPLGWGGLGGADVFKAPRPPFSCPAAEMAQLGTPRRERRAARSGVLPAPHAHPALEKVPNEIPVVFRGLALAWLG